MTRHRLATIAAWLMAGLGGAILLATPLSAQNSCRATCWEAYGACYKATSSRSRCKVQLQSCLNTCIRGKR